MLSTVFKTLGRKPLSTVTQRTSSSNVPNKAIVNANTVSISYNNWLAAKQRKNSVGFYEYQNREKNYWIAAIQ
ncbi:hypothetical protein MA16_Dca009979 [Dendrobium catenatum]|uniref:Uncharacterized protein n=1 Tax=Dendrobium catenatum TaxID=906689 RepID=A0A2I0VIX7_9ASPA|nr:hypothetical protein MA16_Dca009979 [Dendrobium catenatum]